MPNLPTSVSSKIVQNDEISSTKNPPPSQIESQKSKKRKIASAINLRITTAALKSILHNPSQFTQINTDSAVHLCMFLKVKAPWSMPFNIYIHSLLMKKIQRTFLAAKTIKWRSTMRWNKYFLIYQGKWWNIKKWCKRNWLSPLYLRINPYKMNHLRWWNNPMWLWMNNDLEMKAKTRVSFHTFSCKWCKE